MSNKLVHNVFFPNSSVKITLMLSKEEEQLLYRLFNARLAVIEAAKLLLEEKCSLDYLYTATRCLKNIEQEVKALNPELLNLPHDS